MATTARACWPRCGHTACCTACLKRPGAGKAVSTMQAWLWAARPPSGVHPPSHVCFPPLQLPLCVRQRHGLVLRCDWRQRRRSGRLPTGAGRAPEALLLPPLLFGAALFLRLQLALRAELLLVCCLRRPTWGVSRPCCWPIRDPAAARRAHHLLVLDPAARRL